MCEPLSPHPNPLPQGERGQLLQENMVETVAHCPLPFEERIKNLSSVHPRMRGQQTDLLSPPGERIKVRGRRLSKFSARSRPRVWPIF
jgi:hypothetical protein